VKETTMIRILLLAAATFLLAACPPSEGERCNPQLFGGGD
jgi:hypothetical protein